MSHSTYGMCVNACPFCGKAADLRGDTTYFHGDLPGREVTFWIECISCGAIGPRATYHKNVDEQAAVTEAVQKWNARV